MNGHMAERLQGELVEVEAGDFFTCGSTEEGMEPVFKLSTSYGDLTLTQDDSLPNGTMYLT